jgi:uncharacterized protein (DUF427 family)
LSGSKRPVDAALRPDRKPREQEAEDGEQYANPDDHGDGHLLLLAPSGTRTGVCPFGARGISEAMATRYSESLPKDLRYEPTPKWVRAEVGGETFVDTHGAVLVWEPERVVPGYAIPRDDVRMELLEPSGSGADRNAPVAEAWTLELGPRHHEAAAWRYDDENLAEYLAIDWEAMDRWLEEEEEVIGHPRDPFSRIDVRRSSRHVVVRIDGETIAETRRPSLLFETGLPIRFYMPFEDAREDLLIPSATQTVCAYKGRASHWSARVGDEVREDVAWCYPEPLSDQPQIQGLIAFYNERTDIEVDGEEFGRPQTQWSRAA